MGFEQVAMGAYGVRTFSPADYRSPFAAGKPETGQFGDFTSPMDKRLPGVIPWPSAIRRKGAGRIILKQFHSLPLDMLEQLRVMNSVPQ